MADLHEQRKALLARLLADEGLGQPAPDRIPPRSTREPARLSFGQRRLWLLDQMGLPGPPAYNMPAAYLLEGDLDVPALAQSFDALVGRHEVLRTRIVIIDGEPRQVAAADARVTMATSDLTDVADPDATFTRDAAALAQVPFDLATAPLMRVALARLGPSRYGLAVVLHHIVADGWSLPILLREVMAFYADARRRRASSLAPALAPLPLQYADYAVWHRALVESGAADVHREYWRRAFAAPPPPLELPADFPRPQVRSFNGAEVRHQFGGDVLAGLRSLSQSRGASLFMTLLAGVKVLLSRQCGQRDVVVGTPVAGRVRPELADQVGFYVNMLPLQTRLDLQEPFAALVDRVARRTGEALEHEVYPFDLLVHELHLDRDLGRSPLFDVVLVVDQAGDAALGFEGISVTPIDLPRQSSKFDLTLHFVEHSDRLELTLEYSRDLFARDRVVRLAAQLEQLLAAVVRDPGTAVGALPLVSTAERDRLVGLGAMKTPAAWTSGVVDLFEAQVRRRPAAVAATCDEERLTYGELNTRANQLARQLTARGVGAETLVGIALDRSIDFVVAILGVLKAGGAYVPLDPAYPDDRLQYLVADSGLAIVVTRTGDSHAWLAPTDAAVLAIDDPALLVWSGEDVGRSARPDQAAYVIYTSGSTGQPKGCVVTHGNLARLMTATEDWYRFAEDDVWTLFHSLAFDFSVWELWGALAYGGRLVVVPHWVSRAPDVFHELLSREQVTVLNQTPSAFRQLMHADAQAPRPLALRHVIFGGEALDLPSLEPWVRAHGDTHPRLVNMYGITETTVHVTCRPLDRADVAAGMGSVIGAPIPDLSLYVLNEAMEPAPVGVAGEIYVGGAGVCRGYLRRPSLTAERFLPDPFATEPGSRLYRSGDLARWNEAGDLEYLGRSDTQVKIRGFRIEVGEVEAALRAQPDVVDAVVVTRTLGGVQQLLAYVVGDDTALDVASLRPAIGRTLPDYMVPAHVVRLDALPLTAHGKLDVRALPDPEGHASSAFAAPRTAAEQTLSEVWAEALGVPAVGLDDNYFELGGDSILSLRVIAAARARGVEFSIRDLYQRRTIRALLAAAGSGDDAERVETAPFALMADADRAMLPADAEDGYPLSRLQAGMFFHSALEPGSATFHDIFSYRLRLPFAEAAMRAAVVDLSGRHPVLRSSFHWDPYVEPTQVVHTAAAVPVTFEDLRSLPASAHDAAVKRWLDADRQRPLEPARAPLLYVHVHVRADDEIQITVGFHHAILDGWSFATLMTELVGHYLALTRGDAPAPLPPERRFADFVSLEQAALRSEESRAFWSAQVAGLPLTRLPRWPAADDGAAGYDVPLGLLDEVQALAVRLGVPVKSVCLAVHMRVLALLSGERDVVTGLTVNGRPEVEGAERVLGLFLNTVPFRLDVRRDSWRTLVERVFEAEREILPHRRFPLSEIKALAGGRDLYDAGFNFVHFHVYKSISEQVEVLDLTAFEQTDYTFVANFSVDPRDGRLALRLSYGLAEFPPEQIAAIGGYYARALNSLGADAAASLLGPGERQAATRELARGAETGQSGRTIVASFEAQARAVPDATAVVCEGRALTYGELNERSNRVAHHLRSIGIGPDDCVGLCLPRSEWLLVGLLGTLKAGAGYVPIDESHPEERIAYILADSGARVVLTLGSRPGLDVRTLAADGDVTDPGVRIDADHLAYVIYTSGSTGRPKGTMISHGGLAHYLEWAAGEYNVADRQASIVHSSIAFDATITSLLAPLLVGRTVELAPDVHAVQALARALASDRDYSVVKITPAHLDLLRHELGESGPRARVGAFVIGGEALVDATLAWWRSVAPGSRLINEYGPTETVVGCAIFEDRGPGGPAAVPIGRPIDRMRLYVLDTDLEPVPVGTTGEIFIAGPGLARGYVGRPDLTAERFLPDPFADEPGERMYRTGDLGRWRVDGELEYLGRNDLQVKVRGHRVEPGEVESVLADYPGVTEVAVIARPAGGTFELVAYLVGPGATLEGMRTFAARRLPEPLIPSRFVLVAAIPLTTNGKVDRQALLGLDDGGLAPSTPFAPPRTEVERVLATIWQDVLRKSRVGVNEDYFAQGGDSLKALQVISRAARAGLRLRVRDVFDYPTIAELARHVRREATSEAQEAVTGDAPLTPIQRWFFDEHPGPYHHFNQSVMLRWRELVDRAALSDALGALTDHHDALRLRFSTGEDGAWRQEHGAPGVRIEVIEAHGRADAGQLQAGLDPAAGRLVQAAVFSEPDGDRVLLAIHHLSVDGVSWRVLLEDLDTAYRQRVAGEPVRLPLKTASFQRWSRRLGDYAASVASSDAASGERPHWQSVVADATPLPVDGPGTPGGPESVRVQLDVDTTARLFGGAHRAYRTQANDLLLVGLARALEASFGVRRSVIAVEGHGREDAIDLDVSRTVGWFTSRYPIALDLVGDDLRSQIRHVKESLRRVPERGFGYGVLRYLHPAGESLACRPAIGFNYLGDFDGDASSRSFDVTGEATGEVIGPGWRRDHDIDIVATLFAGVLEIRVESTRGRFRPERMQALAEAYVSSLREIAGHCASRPAEPTPSDLAYAGLDIAALDALIERRGLAPELIEDILPLSPMQEGLLFHSLFDRSGAYFEQSAYRLAGLIDPVRFEEAWNLLLARHANLRVAIWHDDLPRPVQAVLRDRRVEFRSEDWRGLDVAEQQGQLARLRADERRRGFDLSRDPLVRVVLLQVGEASFDAVWSFPHLLLDGWSAGILLGELLALYEALVGGRPSGLPEPVPYHRYLSWLDRQSPDAASTYWQRALDGYAETASIPAERRSPQPAAEYQPLSLPWTLGPDETRRLRALAASLHVTSSSLVQALWAALLARYTDRDDVVFGVTVSGRPEELSGVEQMVGLFINTVPMRVRVGSGASVAAIAAEVQAAALEAQPHVACALADIQAHSPLKSHLFDHILVFENYPLDERLRGLGSVLTVESSDVFEQVHYDLALLVAEAPDRLEMRFIANASVYPAARLARVIAHFQELAAGAMAAPERPVRQIRMLPEADQRRLAAFNDNAVATRTGVTLVDLLDEQAARTPGGVAVVHGRSELTYGELHARADQIATELRRRGVGPESLVGVCLHRHPDLIAALIGVLKAGAAYVPLDPAYPAERLAFLITDARLNLVVTERALRSSVPVDDASTLCIDDLIEDPVQVGQVFTARRDAAPDNVAYVIYTSGSTGSPKGTAITHAAAVSLVEWARRAYTDDEMRGVLASTSVCFDLSVFEIFATLSRGGAIVLADTALELPRLARAGDVTLVNTVPSAIAELVRSGGLPASVTTVNLAGEALSAALADALYAIPMIGKVYDLYGPSEDTTYSTVALRARGGPETIGVPLPNTQAYLLDSRMEQVPIGVAGELYLTGDKLSRGYLHRPDLTAARFVPNPWSRDPGGRLYRTGDRARYAEDGTLEFLGRIDQQVKIRGFRIELGEIEAVLAGSGWLRDVAVVAREDVPGDKRVVAYLVRNDAVSSEAGSDAAAYRTFLERTLPDYMVPTGFVFLDRLPLTPNGKLDRRALPPPDATSTRAFEAPRTALEHDLAGIWADVLGVAAVGVSDNFFDLGGHSLKATRIVGTVRRDLGLDLSLRDLFTNPTISALAAALAQRSRAGDAPIPVLPPAADYAVSYGQRRLWVLEQLRGDGPAAYNVPAALLLHGRLDAAALESAFRCLVDRHDVLRTRLVVVNGEPRQDVLATVEFCIDVEARSGDSWAHDLSAAGFGEVARQLAHTPFDLAQAPLMRVVLRRLGPDTHGLAIVLHHIVTDGWSIPVLVRELMAAYRDALEGRAPDLPALRIQYKDYAAWQRAEVDGDGIAPHRAYWRSVFAELPPPLDVPADHPRPAVQTFDGRSFDIALDAGLAREVRRLAARQGASVFMTLLAAAKVLLARMSGQFDVTVGSPMAGRTHADLADQVGYYVNTVPLRTRLDGSEAFSDLLDRVRDGVTAGFEHQAYPFDRLVDDLAIPRDLARSPLFDVMVAMETGEDARLALAGLRVEPLRVDYRISKFDLTVTFRERPATAALDVTFEYNTALFEHDSIERMARRFQTLLRAIVDAPHAAIRSLPMLPDGERKAVVTGWNWAPVARPRGRTLAQLVEEQATRTPDANAVAFGATRLTYRELEERARALASALVDDHGLRPEEPVGLMVEASDRMIVGLLGILKAGGAYVPLDPAYPRERNAWILADAGIRIGVKPGAIPALGDGVGGSVIWLDPEQERWGPPSGGPTRPRRDYADNAGADERLAYVLYTSGSTGRPKGVAVPHRGVVNLLADCQERRPIQAGEACALWTSVSFDVSAYEIFSALVAGGCLHIAGEGMRADPHAYFAWMAEHRVASAYVAPFHLAELREFLAREPGRLPLSRLLVGVEPIDEALLASICALAPGLHIINGYGPTEASICATLYDVPAISISSPLPSRVTPIGVAVGNTAVYVLDGHGEPAGFGMTGELVVAGDGLARGYHGDPAATAAAFVPDQFSSTPGARVYRTGDLGRRLPDGQLVFAGRRDQQVKIRGHRIEIGEVERALAAHPSVRDAVVVARAAGSTRELVAFLVSAGTDDPSVDALRRALQRQLPDYMVPARYVAIDALPLTPSGKVDRLALREGAGRALRVQEGYVAPSGVREEALAGVWAEVLGVSRVGAHDNYFALGGDSIKAIQIAARAGAHGLSIALADLFAHPTVAALAAAARDRTGTAPQGLVTGDVPLTAIQEWFFRENDGPFDHFNQAILLRWKEPVDEAAIRRAGAALIEHHDALRLSAARDSSGVWAQRIRPAAQMAWTIDDLRDHDQAEAVSWMERRADDIHASLSLDAGRVVAGGVFRLPDGDRVLLVIHHLAVDGVSWRILLEDLDAAYRHARTGGALRLPPKTQSFQAWAEAARLAARSTGVLAERDYWRDVCAAQPAPLAAGVHGVASGVERDTCRASLDAMDTRALLAATGASSGETVIRLLAGLAESLRDVFGRDRTGVELEGHGRETSVSTLDVSRTVGWFTSLYPFVLEAGADATTIDTVTRAFRRIPSQGIGFGLLRYLGADNGVDLAVRPDVGFNYLGQFDTDVSTATFGAAVESSGRPTSANWRHAHALDVSAHVVDGRMHLSMAFDVTRLSTVAVERLLDAYVGHLRQLASVVDPVSSELRALLAHHGVAADAVAEVSNLSPMQEGMLFNALFDRESDAYFEQIGYRIRGPLDTHAFERAWSTVLARYPNLLAAIWHEHTSRPVAVTQRNRRVPVTVEDWTTYGEEEQRRRLEQYRITNRRRGFDLERDVLMRFALFQTAADTWEVVWSHHHVLLDGWSTGTLLAEFLAIYQGRAHELPPPVPYTRYLEWIASQDHAAALARWQARLDGYEETASIPPDREGIEGRDAVTAPVLSWTMAPELTRRLLDAGAEQGVTLNTMVQTLWGVLLGRLTDRDDVVFGATVSGRPEALPGVEGMVGLFINTLPVRVRSHDQESFIDLATRVQRESVDARADGFVALAEIQAATRPRAGLFDHILIFENFPLDERVRRLGEGDRRWTIEGIDVFERTHYPLALAVAPADGRLEMRLAYDPARYSPDRIAGVRAQWEHLVSAVAAAPHQPLRAISVLPDEERTRILTMFARGSGQAALDTTLADETLIDLLEAQHRRAPGDVAVSFGEESLTHEALHVRASFVAARLRALGAGPDVPVAICLERSLDLVVGLLGILYAGAPYLPIDPAYPPARIAFMLDDSRASLVVTGRGVLANEIAPAAERLFIDGEVRAPEPASPPDVGAAFRPDVGAAFRRPIDLSPDALAYVLYTSGSTGQPKGVAIPHRAIANHMRWMARAFPLSPRDRVLQKTPFSFDASVWEFWAPLVEGGTLVMASPGVQQDPAALVEAIRRERITVLQVVPTLLQALVEQPGFGECRTLERVFAGGEALSADLQERFFETLPSARLINLYGPTETTIDATYAECRRGDTRRSVSIGSVVDGLTAYVLDRRMDPASVGAWGELCIGGAGVGRGYLHRPGLTAERFVPDPFGGIAGARLYRTGDRARWRADGTLDYGGRLDDQVKVRGFRVEPGEIEAALARHEAIAEAAVVVTADAAALTAYVVASAAAPEASELARRLRDAGLPAHMIPNRFVFLETLPRTPSGKLDRRALAQRHDAREAGVDRIAPRDEREATLAAIWSRVLGVPDIGVDDNFFDLGGHSITAARAAAQMSRDLSITVSVRDVFMHPTVAELSAYLAAAEWAAASGRPDSIPNGTPDSAPDGASADAEEDVTL